MGCVPPPVARLDKRRAEGSCPDERHKLLGSCVYLVGLDLYSCSSIVKISFICSQELGYRFAFPGLKVVSLQGCVLARLKAPKAASTFAYLDTP